MLAKLKLVPNTFHFKTASPFFTEVPDTTSVTLKNKIPKKINLPTCWLVLSFLKYGMNICGSEWTQRRIRYVPKGESTIDLESNKNALSCKLSNNNINNLYCLTHNIH